jgi:hypothetical protein
LPNSGHSKEHDGQKAPKQVYKFHGSDPFASARGGGMGWAGRMIL